MKFPIKITLIVLVLTGLCFSLYIYKYHSLAMEGWKLFNDRCNNVSPLLIKTRSSHLFIRATLMGEVSPTKEEFD